MTRLSKAVFRPRKGFYNMIAIVDYGVGNLFSLQSSLKYIGADVRVTAEPSVLDAAEKIILPGVGAFGDAAQKLRQSGLDEIVIEQAKKGKPLMGICLGMQLLLDSGEEYGTHKGLGLIPGRVVSMKGVVPSGYKLPHIGWNHLSFPPKRGGLNAAEKSPLFKYIKECEFVYFVHSFYAAECDESVIAYTDYGCPITAAVQKDNIYGCQFHPEKSGRTGLAILKAFCEL